EGASKEDRLKASKLDGPYSHLHLVGWPYQVRCSAILLQQREAHHLQNSAARPVLVC
uniref:Uncharacterized protein n=1 Tax=Aegilops tauschii subsp. strangulata TaxID=200361 RepID=A0A453Q7F0_AEGTS